MMDGYGSMAGGGSFGIITWLVIMIDLILLGVWLYKQISK